MNDIIATRNLCYLTVSLHFLFNPFTIHYPAEMILNKTNEILLWFARSEFMIKLSIRSVNVSLIDGCFQCIEKVSHSHQKQWQGCRCRRFRIYSPNGSRTSSSIRQYVYCSNLVRVGAKVVRITISFNNMVEGRPNFIHKEKDKFSRRWQIVTSSIGSGYEFYVLVKTNIFKTCVWMR